MRSSSRLLQELAMFDTVASTDNVLIQSLPKLCLINFDPVYCPHHPNVSPYEPSQFIVT